MDATSAAVAAAAVFVWLGMVLAISFLEAPLKFRAPGVTVRIGLGIGRLVFRALNRVEAVLAVVVIAAVAAGDPPAAVTVLTALVAALLVIQLVGVRPALNRRSDRILSGEEVPRSRAHLLYVAGEVAKAVALFALGTTLLAS
ncbi:hypothetical protein AMK16_25670 [Streptomyces sp. CB00455]|uniref:hypothetical protein n=1 Tax=Streptomyces sp. CB00455 TaxID=1703927 RepID=UPI00093DCBFE|nr:hypothetical protein [Streptomyces sp. CB00455]OKK16109.1 hypothetical protein AMK16_25670 [Streptomyces sp. CB00455]